VKKKKKKKRRKERKEKDDEVASKCGEEGTLQPDVERWGVA
jgi:hypothetical protein